MISGPDAFLLRMGSRIAAARHTRNLTQAQLAEEVGVDARSLQRIEAGRTSPALSRLREIAAVLEVPVGSFFDGGPVADYSRSTSARDDRHTRSEYANLIRAWDRISESRRAFALKLLRLLGSESFE